MKTVKTTELKGVALDWVIAQLTKVPLSQMPIERHLDQYGGLALQHGGVYQPSQDWVHGAAILESVVDNYQRRDGYFYASHHKKRPDAVRSDFSTVPGDRDAWAYGSTLLEAAMRCYARSEYGEEVYIPDAIYTHVYEQADTAKQQTAAKQDPFEQFLLPTDELRALDLLRSCAYWVVEGGEFAEWVKDKEMPWAAAKELVELRDAMERADEICKRYRHSHDGGDDEGHQSNSAPSPGA